MEKCSFKTADKELLKDKIRAIGKTVLKSENKQNTFAQAVNALGQNDYKLEDGAEIKELAAFIHDIIRKYYPKLYTELSLNNIDS